MLISRAGLGPRCLEMTLNLARGEASAKDDSLRKGGGSRATVTSLRTVSLAGQLSRDNYFNLFTNLDWVQIKVLVQQTTFATSPPPPARL